MKQTVRAFALGLLSATILLSIPFLLDYRSKETTKNNYPSTEQMILALEEDGYNVSKLSSEVVDEETSEKENDEMDNSGEKVEISYTLTIEPGMTTNAIVNELFDANVIDDEQAFLTFLAENEYGTKIQPGEFYFNREMTYEEIAIVITKSDS
ncbi:hypothetical protein NC797_10670 [Aquibacillus sp. 3ASR75-11]|uniref:YceG-like family protein n=1 Tax=Terrihalobacillus insolitus TaxID=2950438 RepID=A0A9X3WUR5_9BACI|nr:hypothetical protein [Terrihalobacillus insolitus]MDC3413385.1 hypothetical protein [Terrihalobacillus insolitus]MDC3424968.1 hypothetical protein [Terrihalobacillus insolitus]